VDLIDAGGGEILRAVGEHLPGHAAAFGKRAPRAKRPPEDRCPDLGARTLAAATTTWKGIVRGRESDTEDTTDTPETQDTAGHTDTQDT